MKYISFLMLNYAYLWEIGMYINLNYICAKLLGPGGGNIAPQTFGRLSSKKSKKPVTWIFLTFPEYVYTLNSNKKNCNVNPDRLAECGFNF